MEKTCCGINLEFIRIKYSVYQAECEKCGCHYQYRSGGSVLYKTTNRGQDWVCAKCGGEISGTSVNHPVHDGPFPLSGSGHVKTEVVPYCPSCEDIPDSSGTIITPKESTVL
jgi:hypothetical protein